MAIRSLIMIIVCTLIVSLIGCKKQNDSHEPLPRNGVYGGVYDPDDIHMIVENKSGEIIHIYADTLNPVYFGFIFPGEEIDLYFGDKWKYVPIWAEGDQSGEVIDWIEILDHTKWIIKRVPVNSQQSSLESAEDAQPVAPLSRSRN